MGCVVNNMPCYKDNLDEKLDAIKYYARQRHSVGRCDKSTIDDLKNKTVDIIAEAHRKNDSHIVNKGKSVLEELREAKCW